MVQQPRRRLEEPRPFGGTHYRQRMRRERVENRPGSNVLRMPDERCIDPVQRLIQRFISPSNSIIPRRVKSCTSRCTAEGRAALLPLDLRRRRQRIGIEIGERCACVEIRPLHVEQGLRHRRRIEEGKSLREGGGPPASGTRRTVCQVSGEADVMIIGHHDPCRTNRPPWRGSPAIKSSSRRSRSALSR